MRINKIYFFGLILRDYYLLNFHSKILVLILHISWVVLLENLINNKLSKLDQKRKLYLFSNLKQNLSVESYLSISNFEYRKLITKLRISEHNLLIENGRHLIIPREQRLC